jgi:hypothetical protein
MQVGRLVAGLVGFVALCGIGLAQVSVTKEGSAKLQLCSDLPCVEVLVGSQKLHFAIDTGNPHSVVDVDLPRNEGLDVDPYVGHDGKASTTLKKTALPSVKFGSIELKGLPVLVAHLQHLKAGNTIPEVDGFLGYEAFQGKSLQMDLKKNTIAVSSGSSCSGGTLKLITFGSSGPPIVTATGFSVNGKPVVAQVDTLYAGSMLVFPTAVEKLGLTAEAKSKEREHFPYTDGGVDMIKSTGKEEFGGKTLGGDLYFATPEVHLPDGLFEATVGMKLLAGHTVVFDFAHNCFAVN